MTRGQRVWVQEWPAVVLEDQGAVLRVRLYGAWRELTLPRSAVREVED